MGIEHPNAKLRVTEHKEGVDIQVFYQAWARDAQECIPEWAAKIIWRRACTCREEKEEHRPPNHQSTNISWTPGGAPEGDYDCLRHIDLIDEKGKLFIGCISVTFREMNRIAKQLKWN